MSISTSTSTSTSTQEREKEQEPLPLHLPPSKVTTSPLSSFQDPQNGTLTWRTLISHPETNPSPAATLSAGLARCPAKTGYLALHTHAQDEIYYVTAGRGTVFVGDVRYSVQRGSVVFIPGGVRHGVEVEGLRKGGGDEGEEGDGEALEWFYVFPTGAFGDVVYHFEGEGEGEEDGHSHGHGRGDGHKDG